MRAKEEKIKEEKQSEEKKRNEKAGKGAKRNIKVKKQKARVVTERRVSPRGAPAPIQQLSATRKDRAKHATSATESVTVVEHVEDQWQAVLAYYGNSTYLTFADSAVASMHH